MSKPRKKVSKDSLQAIPPDATDLPLPETPAKDSTRAPALSSAKIAQLKTLYLIKGMRPKEISEKLDINYKQLTQWIWRLKLPSQKAEIQKRLEAKSLAKATSEAESALERWSPQIEELGDDTLDLARKEVANPSKFTAKSLASYSSAMRNWSAMVREFNGIGTNQSANPSQVNIFVGGLARAEPKPVEPVTDV